MSVGDKSAPGFIIKTLTRNDDSVDLLIGITNSDSISQYTGQALPHDVRSIAGGSKGFPIVSSNVLCQKSHLGTIAFNKSRG